jgi:predicted transposase/invertase (TIGR01784 family)
MPSESLLHDIVFKLVFGEKGHEPMLRAMLNALLELSGSDRIAEVVILNPISEKRFFTEKGSILDLHCQDEKGSHYVVEIQVQSIYDHIQRTVYYAASQIRSQLNPGDEYGKLERLVVISIVDFTLFADHDDLQSKIVLYDVAHQRPLTDRLEVHFLELKKFKGNQPAKLRTPFERWLHLLKFSPLYARDDSEIPQSLRNEEGIEMVIKALRETLASQEVQELIRARDMAEHDAASRLVAAKKEGQEQTQLVVAQRMLASGFSVEQTAKISGLTIEHLRQFQKASD